MRRFTSVDLISDQIPDETTILTIRQLLEKRNLGEQILEKVKTHHSARDMTMNQGTMVDATLITAPSSTKKKGGRRDPEMHLTKKGSRWYFGMKVHIAANKESSLIQSVVTTTANVHDLTQTGKLLHGDEEVVYCDAGYQGIAKRPEMAVIATDIGVAMRTGERRVLPDTQEGRLQDLIETAKAHIHSKVEDPFRVIKQQLGFQKTRLSD